MQDNIVPISEVSIKPLDPESHLPLLQEWLRRPHVSRWWGVPEEGLADLQRRAPDTCAVIVADGTAVGYLCWQTLPQSEREAAGLTGLPEDLVDIDILIGEPDVLNREVGSSALGLLLDRLRVETNASAAGVGTSVSNKRAIRAFQKAGFEEYCEFEDPEFGSGFYMINRLN